MKTGKAYIGTSGWHYKHWKEVFYPAKVAEREQLVYYAQHFDTVEINNSFYNLPEISTFKNWKKITPAKFVFAVKASRFITHIKKLNTDKTSINKFLNRTLYLEEKLGPVLFQLPPRWKINAERFEEFLKRLPKGIRYAFEFRNQTWYDEKIDELLKKYNCAFCIYHLQRHLTPLIVTADFIYIRLHGPGDKYQGSYPNAALKKWANQIREWQKQRKDVYIFFDNDQNGYAAFNAEKLISLISNK